MPSNNFDDYEFKNTDKKVSITLKQKKCKIMSPWEVSSFVANLNTYYYKTEVINTIGIALNQGISPNNILIFDESFKLNQTYNYLHNIDCNSNQLQHLYTLGNPIALMPNKKILLMKKIFGYIRKLNEFTRKVNNKYIYRRDIYKLYNTCLSSGKYEVMDVIENVSRALIENITDKRTRKNYNKLIDSLKKDDNKLANDWNDIIEIEETLISNKWSDFNQENKLFKEYFQQFYRTLSFVHRPVVGIIDNETNQITIMCRAHINKEEQKSVTLDLKSISHNSPIKAIFEGGATIYSAITGEKRHKEIHEIRLKREELECKILETQLKTAETDLEIKRLDLYDKKIDTLTNIQKLESGTEIDSIDDISNPYLKNKLDIQNDNLRKKRARLLNNGNFKVDILETRIIDLKA